MDKKLSKKIAEFEPQDGNWLILEDLLQQALSSSDCQAYYSAIFKLFEHYPEEDGAGVFWTALHGMEDTGGYEKKLLESFRRIPSEMAETMLFRLRNSGQKYVSGVPIESLIED
ncbi:hypothetical protein SAMN02745753_02509 [Marinomonas polaris DSM 16579]|uniref:Uncharacterized protein n=1 Tax=Marinomonas polaris DSM 16579 TaxID=1122206 RepID=A0A1M5DUH9_9GAMM|nr:hypothetical protein [Marinomonas polaris]SHF70585.1 hypothetical protein SAMN02745753_02509 [Marinomonas polaris DSM 16579]